MATLTVTGTLNYNSNPPPNPPPGDQYVQISFATSGFSVATFGASQFGPSAIISDFVTLNGDANTNVLEVLVTGSFDASNWSFINWSSTDFSIFTGNSAANTIVGTTRDDSFRGGAGLDNLFGGEGDDVFEISASNEVVAGDLMDGSNGTDTVLVTAAGLTNLRTANLVSIEQLGITSTVELTGSQANALTLVYSYPGNATVQTLHVYGSSINLSGIGTFQSWGSEDVISLEGNAVAANNITGSYKADVIAGGSANDTLSGGSGNDQFLSGSGNDSVTGGSGNNTVADGGGTDVAHYALASTAATITHNVDGTWTVTDGLNSDTLTGIERLTFAGDNKTISIRETARADLTGNGTSDVVWINASNGAANYFNMSNGTVASWDLAGVVNTAWTASATGDVTGDGNADILYRRSSDGAIGILDQDNLGNWGWQGLGAVSAAWGIAAVGDFNGNGTSDILYQNAGLGGALGILQNNNNVVTWGGIGAVNTAWQVSGAGNINGDGTDDIVFYNATNGSLNALTMSGGTGTWINIAVVNPSWTVAGMGDLNGDGTSDILMYNAALGGALGYFQMHNGVGTWTSLGGVGAVGADWAVEAMGDYNGDGYCDILLYNSTLSAAGVLTESANGNVTWSGLGAVNGAWQIL